MNLTNLIEQYDNPDPNCAHLVTIVCYDHTNHGVHGDVYCGQCGVKQQLPKTWLHTPEYHKRNMWTT